MELNTVDGVQSEIEACIKRWMSHSRRELQIKAQDDGCNWKDITHQEDTS